jgi:hypothetical protein
VAVAVKSTEYLLTLFRSKSLPEKFCDAPGTPRGGLVRSFAEELELERVCIRLVEADARSHTGANSSGPSSKRRFP